MLSSTRLPPISSFPSLPTSAHAEVLALLFEPSPALSALGVPITSSSPPFLSYDVLIQTVGEKLRSLAASGDEQDMATLDEVLSSHPRLGEKKVDSALSRLEQAAMEAASQPPNDGDEADAKDKEKAELERLNAEYESKFPGLRYVVFVNGRSRPVIFKNIRTRIARGDIGAERLEAIQAMCDIASDRALKLS